MRYYVLDGKTVTGMTMQKWAAWMREFGTGGVGTKVARDKLADGTEVSTVFLAINHNHVEDAPPILFETMVFGGDHDGRTHRYSTWDEAMAGHKECVHFLCLMA